MENAKPSAVGGQAPASKPAAHALLGEIDARTFCMLRVGVLLLAAAPRLWAAFADQGLFWPDEFYQSTEQAHRFAFGYGIVPWEFVEGARSWVYPGAIGLLWKLMAGLGVTSAATLIVAAKLAVASVAVAGVEAAMRIAQRAAGQRAAVMAGVLVAMFPALVLFGSKCMTETVSAPLILFSILLTFTSASDGPTGSAAPRVPVRALGAGAVACLAIFFRYQNGAFAISLFVLLLSQRRWKDALYFAVAGCVVGALLGGVLDALTWGRPFNSFLKYAQFHAENRSAPWGSSPAIYYLRYTATSAGPFMVVALLGFVLSLQRHYRYALVVLVYVLLHSIVPHKEYRYVTPIVPLFLTLSAIGLSEGTDDLLEKRSGSVDRTQRARWAWIATSIVAALALLGFGERTIRMTFADLGHGDGLAAGLADGNDSPWHAAEGVNRALWAVGRASDVCGVVVRNIPWSSTGGYAYLHRDVPMFFEPSKRSLAAANYLIESVHDSPLPGFEAVAGQNYRDFVVLHRAGACAPPPADYTRTVPP